MDLIELIVCHLKTKHCQVMIIKSSDLICDRITVHTFSLLASFHNDVSIQLLQLSVQVVHPPVGRAQLTVHLREREKTRLALKLS